MENECEALPGVAYPGVRDNRSTLNTKTGYDDEGHCWVGLCAPEITLCGQTEMDPKPFCCLPHLFHYHMLQKISHTMITDYTLI